MVIYMTSNINGGFWECSEKILTLTAYLFNLEMLRVFLVTYKYPTNVIKIRTYRQESIN